MEFTLYFVFAQFLLVALYDTIQIDAEKIYWRKGGYDKEASTQTSIGMFLFWYLEIALFLFWSDVSIGVLFRYVVTFAFLHYAGFEDFLYYVWEPIFKADELSGRDNPAKYYRFLWWRLPRELYWLGEEGHNSRYITLFAGPRVNGLRFLLGVLVAVAIVLSPNFF